MRSLSQQKLSHTDDINKLVLTMMLFSCKKSFTELWKHPGNS